MSDQLRLTGLSFTGYHGVFDYEKRDGQRFVIDLVIDLDIDQAASSDELAHTLNYADLAKRVAKLVTGEPVDLIETLAHRILQVVWDYPQPTGASVTVHKPDAPIGHQVDDVSITLTRNRPESRL